MFKWNVGKVKQLKGTEIWLFIIARVLLGFGLGVLAAQYFPQVASSLSVLSLVLGILLFAIASKGLFRKT